MYIFPVCIHEYIKNKFLTCTREIGDPTLSKNIDLNYVVPKDKQGKKLAKKYLKMLKEQWDYLFLVNLQAEVTHGT